MELAETLAKDSKCTADYLILVIASASIATFGLLENNVAVIIGAMIIAPLMSPIQGMAYGAIAGNGQIFRSALTTLAIGTFVAAVIAAVIQGAVALPAFGSEIIARSKPNLLDLGIAIAAGAVSGLSRVRTSISSAIVGTAVAVALMPPVCVIGITIASRSWHLALGASLLYVTNLLGITVACMVAYLATGRISRTDRGALIAAIAMTTVLAIPLAGGLFELLRFERLEHTLSSALLSGTTTFKHVELVQMNVDWLANPPVATLTVRSTEPITPSQVEDLEQFAFMRTGQRFVFVFEVTPLAEVRSSPH